MMKHGIWQSQSFEFLVCSLMYVGSFDVNCLNAGLIMYVKTQCVINDVLNVYVTLYRTL